MTIAEYFKKNPTLTTTEFAKKIGVSQPFVTYLIRGVKKPSKETAEAIERETDGDVRASDLLEHLVPEGYELVRKDTSHAVSVGDLVVDREVA